MPMDAPSPDGDVMVCTPPGTQQLSVPGSPIITPFIQPDLVDLQETALSRQYQSFAAHSQPQYSSPVDGTSSMSLRLDVIVDDIPFFQFQEIFRSEGVRSGFEKILTVKDDLCDDIVHHFWPGDSSARDLPSNLFGMVPSTISWEVIDEFDYVVPASMPCDYSTMTLYKPFAADLIPWGASSDFDVLEYHDVAKVAIPELLAMMPSRKEDDIQSDIALLLGPPVIRAAHLFVEIGVYLATNYTTSSFGWKTITWMLNTVPWSILRPILLMHVPTIRQFSMEVFDFAIRHGYVQIVTDLLQLPLLQAAVMSKNMYLCSAVRASNLELVELLLGAGSNPNKGRYGTSEDLPMELVEDVRIAQSLVRAGANVRPTSPHSSHTNLPLLAAAVEKGNFELVHYLIEMGVDVNTPKSFDDDKRLLTTPLTMAVSSGRLDIAELLLEHGADTNPVVRAYEFIPWNEEGSFIYPSQCYIQSHHLRYGHTVRVFLSLLQIAVALRSHKIVELLVDYGSRPDESQCSFKQVNRKRSRGRVETALQIAVCNGDITIAEFLLRNGANVNAVGYSATNYPITALFLAMDRGDSQLVDLLLNGGADLDLSYYGLSFLQAARSKSNCARIVDMLLAKNAPEFLIMSNDQRDHELQEAVARGDKEWVKRSLALGGVVNMRPLRTKKDPRGRRSDLSILHLALKARPFNSEIFQLIVARMPDLAAHKINHNMIPLLHQAVSVGELEAAEILIRAGVDVNEVYRGKTPLIRCAALTGDLAMMSLLLNLGADLNVVVGEKKFNTALKACLWRSYFRSKDYGVFYFLMSKEASINTPIAPIGGLSELAHAALGGRIDIIQLLLDQGADVNAPAPAAKKLGFTALQAAASSSNANLDVIRLLLDRGADVNAPAAELGFTALQAAAYSYKANLDVTRLLLDRGADVNAPGSKLDGSPALYGAAQRGKFQTVVQFLQVGADVNIRSSGFFGSSALCGAAYFGRLDTVQLLLQNGADMDLPENERYNEAIRIARRRDHLVVAELLDNWPTSEAGRKAIAKFGHLYKGAERVEEVSGEDMPVDSDNFELDSSESDSPDENTSDEDISDSDIYDSD
ncbi:hypothetical protein CJF32_00008208 [Rutstroemia sp. NJR-2017a WRK4]|nr:hypothetical protein CJF32_00008208 [Rutstroemia sp. NJR-2017a WRK4]